LNGDSLILPYHLESFLKALDLNLSKIEFKKLWQRFDLNNCGGVNTQVFLRLLDYNTNRIEKLSEQTDMLRTKSFVIQKRTNRLRRNQESYAQEFMSKSCANESEKRNDMSTKIDLEKEQTKIDKATNSESQEIKLEEKPASSSEDSKNERTNCETSMSDSRLKMVVQTVRQSNKFGSNQDLATFLNQKLNESYIFMKTAFKYIDNEQVGHLFIDEFKCVLDEFDLSLDQNACNYILTK